MTHSHTESVISSHHHHHCLLIFCARVQGVGEVSEIELAKSGVTCHHTYTAEGKMPPIPGSVLHTHQPSNGTSFGPFSTLQKTGKGKLHDGTHIKTQQNKFHPFFDRIIHNMCCESVSLMVFACCAPHPHYKIRKLLPPLVPGTGLVYSASMYGYIVHCVRLTDTF